MSLGDSLSVVAIVLAGASFYVSTLRRGRLRILEAPTYALSVGDGRVIFHLPLTFVNTGYRDFPIVNLRVVAPEISEVPLSMIATHDALVGSEGGTGRRYATGFVVPARQTMNRIVEFQSGKPVTAWKPNDFDATILVQTERGRESYRFGARFPVRVDTTGNYHALLAHENADEPDIGAMERKSKLMSRLPRLSTPVAQD